MTQGLQESSLPLGKSSECYLLFHSCPDVFCCQVCFTYVHLFLCSYVYHTYVSMYACS